MEYLWAWGTLIYEKNLRSKISCQTPFKYSPHIFGIKNRTKFTFLTMSDDFKEKVFRKSEK